MILRGLFLFVFLLIASSILMTNFHVPFGSTDFFEKHGILFLIGIAIFPRLTLLLSSVVSGGLLWWLGWLAFPRVLVAVLATFAYFQTNPVLVTISWLVALGGEGFEKQRFFVKTYRASGRQHNPPRSTLDQGDVIEAEYKKL